MFDIKKEQIREGCSSEGEYSSLNLPAVISLKVRKGKPLGKAGQAMCWWQSNRSWSSLLMMMNAVSDIFQFYMVSSYTCIISDKIFKN